MLPETCAISNISHCDCQHYILISRYLLYELQIACFLLALLIETTLHPAVLGKGYHATTGDAKYLLCSCNFALFLPFKISDSDAISVIFQEYGYETVFVKRSPWSYDSAVFLKALLLMMYSIQDTLSNEFRGTDNQASRSSLAQSVLGGESRLFQQVLDLRTQGPRLPDCIVQKVSTNPHIELQSSIQICQRQGCKIQTDVDRTITEFIIQRVMRVVMTAALSASHRFEVALCSRLQEFWRYINVCHITGSKVEPWMLCTLMTMNELWC